MVNGHQLLLKYPLVYFITHLYSELGQYLSPSDSQLANASILANANSDITSDF